VALLWVFLLSSPFVGRLKRFITYAQTSGVYTRDSHGMRGLAGALGWLIYGCPEMGNFNAFAEPRWGLSGG